MEQTFSSFKPMPNRIVWLWAASGTCLVFLFSYLAARLGGVLVLRPEMIWPIWPGNAFLVAVLLRTNRKTMWPVLLLAGLAGFAVYDSQEGLSTRSALIFLLSDTVEILVATLGVKYIFGGTPCLNNVKSLAKYSLFAVLIAPAVIAWLSANAIRGAYRTNWAICFLTEALALLMLTPAILGWADLVMNPAKRPTSYYVEAALMLSGLAFVSYFAFSGLAQVTRPALFLSLVPFYAVVPFMLWSALRFGITGISTAMVILSFFSIRGELHSAGVFQGASPLTHIFALQLFLLCGGASFIVLAAVVEQQKEGVRALYETNRALERQTSLAQAQEDLLRIFVRDVPAAVAMFDREMRYLQASDQWCKDFAIDGTHLLGRSHYEIFPDLPDRYKEVHARALAGETVRADEDLWYHEGRPIWSRWEALPWWTLDGTPGGIFIFVEVITRRKQMEEALAEMRRKLLEAQEQERARIARELHDDINQRVAMLAIELGQLAENPSGLPVRAQQLRKSLGEISADLQALSHELHSSKMELLGVVAGIKGWCMEFSERQKIEIRFSSNVSSVVSREIGITLLRVLQEALHNALKYSGVRRVDVDVAEQLGNIEVIIRDNGVGFDVAAAMQGHGLGLSSMSERVRLMDGTIVIDSKPMSGTTIHVRLPLKSERGSKNAAAWQKNSRLRKT